MRNGFIQFHSIRRPQKKISFISSCVGRRSNKLCRLRFPLDNATSFLLSFYYFFFYQTVFVFNPAQKESRNYLSSLGLILPHNISYLRSRSFRKEDIIQCYGWDWKSTSFTYFICPSSTIYFIFSLIQLKTYFTSYISRGYCTFRVYLNIMHIKSTNKIII